MIGLAYWIETLIRVGAGAGILLTAAAVAVYLFLFKLVSFMQSRLGPMEAGPHGSLQLVAEVGKWLQKQDIIPDAADRTLFKIPPFIALGTTFLLFVVIPAGPNAVVANIPAGIFYILAVASISILGTIIAGWASANKYALMGAIRAAGQMIAYELPMVLAVVGVVIAAGTLNLQEIIAQQAGGEIFGLSFLGNPYILTQFVGFGVFMIAVQAELGQTPFDMPIAESEVVGGYHIEYTGIRFLVFFLSEFASAVGFSAVAATLFLGGWQLPLSWGIPVGAMHAIGPLVILAKAIALTGLIFWARFSMPRLREDQLQAFAWKVLIPVSLANIAITAILKVAL
ncbi:MAG: NADH-quinone oxidoreductase subunit H [Actinobacteria bacterium]|nr:NADH-quinone oxidoreductase subunit H [Actinomycetota bacterium]